MRRSRASRSVIRPLAGRQHGHAQAAEDAGHLVGPGVDAQAGLGHPLDARDGARRGRGSTSCVISRRLPGPARILVHVEAHDVALALAGSSASDSLSFEHGIFTVSCMRRVGVADAGQHVGDRVGHRHRRRLLLTSSPWSRRGSRRRAPARAGRSGTGRTCGNTDLGPAAPAAARVGPHLELRLALLLFDQCLLGHGATAVLLSEREAEGVEQARPSASVRAVVTMVMSMPRVVSILS